MTWMIHKSATTNYLLRFSWNQKLLVIALLQIVRAATHSKCAENIAAYSADVHKLICRDRHC